MFTYAHKQGKDVQNLQNTNSTSPPPFTEREMNGNIYQGLQVTGKGRMHTCYLSNREFFGIRNAPQFTINSFISSVAEIVIVPSITIISLP